MNWFYFFYFFILEYGILSIIEFHFFSRFLDCRANKSAYLFYSFLLYLFAITEIHAPFPSLSPLFLLINIGLLTGIGRYVFKRSSLSFCFLSAILTKTIAILIQGMMCPILLYILTQIIGTELSSIFFISLLPTVASLSFLYLTYLLILKYFILKEQFANHYFAVILTQIFLVYVMEQYIISQVYGNEVVITNQAIIKPLANHIQMLLVQVFVFGSLFCALFACKKLSEEFTNQTQLCLLKQELHTQKEYLLEATWRFEQTRSIRHDMKNHLVILDGLLEKAQINQVRAYIGKLDTAVSALSFPCHTNHPIIDIILGSKLGTARQSGIRVECTLQMPDACKMDDLDICVIFSNAIDNAMKACTAIVDNAPYIRIYGKLQGDFFMITFENSYNSDMHYPKGQELGLKNIQAVASKYQGAIHAQAQLDLFRLDVLIVISQQINDNS